MNANQTKLLAEADRMSESMLVRMEDWQLACLRVAMKNQVEETLNAALFGETSTQNHNGDNSLTREGGVAPSHVDAMKHRTKLHASAWGRGDRDHTDCVSNHAQLVEAAR